MENSLTDLYAIQKMPTSVRSGNGAGSNVLRGKVSTYFKKDKAN